MRFTQCLVLPFVAMLLPVMAAHAAETPAPTSSPAVAEAPKAEVAKPAAESLKIGGLVDPNTISAFRNTLKAGTSIHYMGDEFGLKAYFLTNGAAGYIAYVTPDSQAYLMGSLFGADGTPISALQAARMKVAGFDPSPYLGGDEPAPPPALDPAAPQPAASASAATTVAPTAPSAAPATPPAAQPAVAPTPSGKKSAGQILLTEANSASWIAYGSALAPQVTVFMDPGCSECHKFFQSLLPYAEQKKIYLRVIPVTAIDPTNSPQKVAKVFSMPVPAEAWKGEMTGRSITAGVTASPEALSATTANEALFDRWKLPGTPYSLYTSKETGQVKVLFGTADDFSGFLKDLGVQP